MNMREIKVGKHVTCDHEICGRKHHGEETFVPERDGTAAILTSIFCDYVAVDIVANVRLDAERGEI